MSISGNHLDTRILKSLLVRDSFDSTYKFALLRTADKLLIITKFKPDCGKIHLN